MLEIEQIQPIEQAPQVMSIDKSFILNELKNILGQSGLSDSPCEVIQPTPNSLDYHVNDQIEIVEEPVSPAGY